MRNLTKPFLISTTTTLSTWTTTLRDVALNKLVLEHSNGKLNLLLAWELRIFKFPTKLKMFTNIASLLFRLNTALFPQCEIGTKPMVIVWVLAGLCTVTVCTASLAAWYYWKDRWIILFILSLWGVVTSLAGVEATQPSSGALIIFLFVPTPQWGFTAGICWVPSTPVNDFTTPQGK